MLSVWDVASDSLVTNFCETHSTLTGESLNREKLKLYTSNMSPYEGYTLLRLELPPQVLTRKQKKYAIATRAVSYALFAIDSSMVRFPLIPLFQSGRYIAGVNTLLRNSVTRLTAQRYAVFFGQLVSREPFHFFNRLEQLDLLLSRVSEEDKTKLKSIVTGLFGFRNDGSLRIEVSEESHFFFGRYFKLKLPCIYEGKLYVTKLRIATNGMIEMDNDEELDLEGVFDEEANLTYYPLDVGDELAKELERTSARRTRIHRFISTTLIWNSRVERSLLVWFIFQFFLILRFGSANSEVSTYFASLQESRVLSLMCLLVGLAGSAVSIFRYSFVELSLYAKGLVPSTWSETALILRNSSRDAVKQIGVPLYILQNFGEYSLRSTMVLSLFLYGISNIFQLHAFPSKTLAMSIIDILVSIPLLGWLLAHLPLSCFHNVTKHLTITVFVSFMFSTVILGLLGRLYTLAKKEG